MSKRAAEVDDDEQRALKSGQRPQNGDYSLDGPPNFEDEYEDEFESEDEIMEAGVDGEPDGDDDAADQMEVDNQTFIPGRHKLDPGQVLAPDLSTYELLHTLSANWPCLSFDVLRDQLGTGRARKKYPATVYSVAGTQAARGHDKENEILVMKMSKLAKMDRPDEEDSSDEEDDDDDDDENADPILETRSIKTGTCTNRIRAWQSAAQNPGSQETSLTAAMTEKGDVLIHNITPHLASLENSRQPLDPSASNPTHTIKSHGRTEGFAVDWSPPASSSDTPRLVTGDLDGRIFAHTSTPSGAVKSDARPFTGHAGSVEELQWSPTEAQVFASASSDGTVNIWDTRSKAHKPALGVRVSPVDVNVLSWSRQTAYLLATGADDGAWAVWDLRGWKAAAADAPAPVASFAFHKEQVTSVEWHPTDDSVVAVAAADNTVSLWDVAVEHDDEESRFTADAKDVPPQLMFVHYMDGVKEAHWHPQQDGLLMATGESGFGVFKTISV